MINLNETWSHSIKHDQTWSNYIDLNYMIKLGSTLNKSDYTKLYWTNLDPIWFNLIELDQIWSTSIYFDKTWLIWINIEQIFLK